MAMTPDDLGGYLSLLPYWAFGLALAGSFYKGMVWLGGHFAPDFRQDLTDWLQGKRDKVWVENFCNLFDTLFGPRHVAWRACARRWPRCWRLRCSMSSSPMCWGCWAPGRSAGWTCGRPWARW
jgi:hypothetical protein